MAIGDPVVPSIRDVVGFCVACRQAPVGDIFSPTQEERYLCARCLEEIRGLREDRLERRRRREARRRAWAEFRLALGSAVSALRRYLLGVGPA